MKWNEKVKGQHWVSGEYAIRIGNNSAADAGVRVPADKANVYHCYLDPDYIMQCNSIDDAKEYCEQHKKENKQ